MCAVDLLHTYGTPKEKGAFLRTSLPFDKYLQKRIVISHYLRDYFIKHYPIAPNKIDVIYNGVPPLSTTELNDHILQDVGMLHKTSAITYIGRLQEDKSPQRLVEIAYRSKASLLKAKTKILVVGDGQLRQKLETYAKQLGVLNKTIKFIGYHGDPLSIAKSSRFTILTSDLEGIPMSILESMQVGTPPIATAVGGIPEIFDSTHGLLVALGSNQATTVANLSSAVDRALTLHENDYSSMQAACKLRINEKFSTMPQQYHKLFMTLVK
jgi:glycosyltransferase involved in cell wall biosynthesis